MTAIDSVGVYVPGGKASYPSTVMMNVIPARVAGVGKIYMSCPIDDIKSITCDCAGFCKVDSIFKWGELIQRCYLLMEPQPYLKSTKL